MFSLMKINYYYYYYVFNNNGELIIIQSQNITRYTYEKLYKERLKSSWTPWLCNYVPLSYIIDVYNKLITFFSDNVSSIYSIYLMNLLISNETVVSNYKIISFFFFLSYMFVYHTFLWDFGKLRYLAPLQYTSILFYSK